MLTSLLLGVSFVGIQVAFACTCIPWHPQHHFCTADYVIEAQIISEKIESLKRVYNFTLNKVYKVPKEGTNVLSKGKLVTQADSAACGTKLFIGKKYLLTGSVFEDELRISSCDLYKSSDTLTDFEKDSFNNLFAQNCNCNVITEGFDSSTIKNETCLWNTFPSKGYTEDCQKKYAVCKYNGDSCNWEGNTMYEECYNKDS